MKFVLITYDGHGLPIAYKLQNEGWDVIVGQIEELEYMPKEEPEIKKRRLELYNKLLDKRKAEEVVEILRKETKRDDYIVWCDFNYVYPYAERIKQLGYFGLFPTKEDFELEEDRKIAKEFIENNHPLFAKEEVVEFKTIKEAIEFLEKTDKCWVLKGDSPDAKTIVSLSNEPQQAAEEIIEALENEQKIYESEGFILEEKIEDLIEFVPEIIVRGNKVLGMSINVELKPLGPANCGPQTGDSASTIFWINNEEQAIKIYKQFFVPLSDFFLRSDNEFVIWDVGAMYSPSRNKFYFTEFCSNREGFNAFFDKLSTFQRIGDYYLAIKEGIPFNELKLKRFGAGIRIFNMLFENQKGMEHLFLSSAKVITNPFHKDIWLWDVKGENNKIVSVGYDRNLAVVTSSDDDWQMAFLKAEALIDGEFKFNGFYKRSFVDIIDNGYIGNIPDRIKWVFENILQEKLEFKLFSEYKAIKKTLIEKNKEENVFQQNIEKQMKTIEELIKKYTDE